MKKFFLHLTLIISLFTISAKAQSKIIVSDLKCEMLTNPEGIDVLQPRLSWKIKANVNDVKQTHYQILASSSLDKLNAGNGDLENFFNAGYDEKAFIELIALVALRSFTNYVFANTQIPIDFPLAQAV